MTASPEHFVDFQNVWLAYNDELLAQDHFAVEDINLQVKQGEFLHEAHHGFEKTQPW
jgi:NitT/TauT family transport system ATP-binding protein